MESRWAALSLGHQSIPEIPWVEVVPGLLPLPFRTKGNDEGEQWVGSHLRSKWGDIGATPGTRNVLVCGQPTGELSGKWATTGL